MDPFVQSLVRDILCTLQKRDDVVEAAELADEPGTIMLLDRRTEEAWIVKVDAA